LIHPLDGETLVETFHVMRRPCRTVILDPQQLSHFLFCYRRYSLEFLFPFFLFRNPSVCSLYACLVGLASIFAPSSSPSFFSRHSFSSPLSVTGLRSEGTFPQLGLRPCCAADFPVRTGYAHFGYPPPLPPVDFRLFSRPHAPKSSHVLRLFLVSELSPPWRGGIFFRSSFP